MVGKNELQMKEALFYCIVYIVFAFCYILEVKGDALPTAGSKLYFSNTNESHRKVTQVPQGGDVELPCRGRGKGQLEIGWLKNKTIIGYITIQEDKSALDAYELSKVRFLKHPGDLPEYNTFSTSLCPLCNSGDKVAQNNCCITAHGALKLFNTNTSLNGHYQCIISNKYGSLLDGLVQLLSTSNSILNITSPHPLPRVNDTVRLECGQPSAKSHIKWFKNNQPIQSNNDYSILPAPGVLIINQLLPHLSGSYSCFVTDGFAKYRSNPMSISTHGSNPQEHLQLLYTSSKYKVVETGKTVTLECLPTRNANSPTMEYSWLLNGKDVCADLQNSCNIETIPGVLTIHNITSQNNGNYTCALSNGRKTIFSSTYVHSYDNTEDGIQEYPPTAVAQKRTSTFQANCVFENYRDLKLKWVKDGVEIPHGRSMRTTVTPLPGGIGLNIKRSLLIDGDEGFYQCIGESKNDYLVKTTRLDITDKINIAPPTNITYEAGQNSVVVYWNFTMPVNSTDEFKGYYVLCTAWPNYQLDNQPVEADQTMAVIKGLTPFTTYELILQPLVKRGATQHAEFTFKTQEGLACDTVRNLDVVERSGRSVLLSWEPIEEAKRCGTIISYLLIYQFANEGETKIEAKEKQIHVDLERPDDIVYATLNDLDCTLDYGFAVKAETRVGMSDKETPFLTVSEVPEDDCCTKNTDLKNTTISYIVDRERGILKLDWSLPMDMAAHSMVSVRATAAPVNGETGHGEAHSGGDGSVYLNITDNEVPMKLEVFITYNGTSCHLVEYITKQPDILAGPSITSLVANRSKCLDIEWTGVSGMQYVVRVSEASTDFNINEYYKSTKPSIKICGLQPDTSYNVAVSARSGNEFTAFGKLREITTKSEAPTEVQNLQATDMGAFTYWLHWLPPMEGKDVSYQIIFANETKTLTDDDGRTAIELTCVKPHMPTRVSVVAYNIEGRSKTSLTIEPRNVTQEIEDHFDRVCVPATALPPRQQNDRRALTIVIIILVLMFLMLVLLVAWKLGHPRCVRQSRNKQYNAETNGRSRTMPYHMDKNVHHHPSDASERLISPTRNGHSNHNGNGKIYNGNGKAMNGNGVGAYQINSKKSPHGGKEPCWKKAKKHLPRSFNSSTRSNPRKEPRNPVKTRSTRFLTILRPRPVETDYINSPVPKEINNRTSEVPILLSIPTPSQSQMNQAACERGATRDVGGSGSTSAEISNETNTTTSLSMTAQDDLHADNTTPLLPMVTT